MLESSEPLLHRRGPGAINRKVFRPVAGHTAHLVGLLEPAVLCGRQEVAALTGHPGEIHWVGTGLDPFPSDSEVKIAGRRVAREVAAPALRRHQLQALGNLVGDLLVAVEALHLVLGHVGLVEKFRLFVTGEPGRFLMTTVTALLGDPSLSLDDPLVTEGALHPEALHVGVIEAKERPDMVIVRLGTS